MIMCLTAYLSVYLTEQVTGTVYLSVETKKTNNMNNTKPTKLDRIICNSFPLLYLGGWALIVLCIIFS